MGVQKREAAWRKWRMSEEDVRGRKRGWMEEVGKNVHGRKRGHVGNVKEDER